MGNMNRVFLMGNLTRDPKVRKTPSGLAVSDLGLAVNERYRSKAGTMVESVCFADVVVWGRQAESCEQHLAKGSAIIVEGRLQLDQWKTTSGEQRSRLRVRADRVQFIGKPRREAAGDPSAHQSRSMVDREPEGATEGGENDSMPF